MFIAAASHRVAVFLKFFEFSFDLVKIRAKNKRFGAYVSHKPMLKWRYWLQ